MGQDDILAAAGSIAAGIIGGLALIEILDKIFVKRCPHCKSEMNPQSKRCGGCGSWVE